MSEPEASRNRERDKMIAEYEDLVRALIVERQRPVPAKPMSCPSPHNRSGPERRS